jgi:hypothetical protein
VTREQLQRVQSPENRRPATDMSAMLEIDSWFVSGGNANAAEYTVIECSRNGGSPTGQGRQASPVQPQADVVDDFCYCRRTLL